MNQKIIDKTLELNLFKPSKKVSNYFLVYQGNPFSTSYYFTESIPFHYFQHICLALTYSETFMELCEFRETIKNLSCPMVVSNKNKIHLDNFSILNCQKDCECGAFSRFWIRTKIEKNLIISHSSHFSRMLNELTPSKQTLLIRTNTYNNKFKYFECSKPCCYDFEMNNFQENIQLLIEFTKLFLVKK